MAGRLRVGFWLGLVILATPGAAPPPPDSLESCWSDLEQDEATAARALLRLDARPREAVAFLADKMKPLRLDPDRLQLLLSQLASNEKAVWKPAFEELEYFDPRLAVDLEQLMKDVTKSPARQRMVEVLSGRAPGNLEGQDVNIRSTGRDGKSFNFFSRGSWWAEKQVARLNTFGRGEKKKWTRAVRAIVFLEHVGTPEAAAVLKAMAAGDPDAQPTRAAREALDRLARGPVADDPAVAPDLTKIGDPALWSFSHAGAEAAEEDGRKAAVVKPVAAPNDTRSTLPESVGVAYFFATNFDEGTIDVDLKAGADGGPLGVAFHGSEVVYFRPAHFRDDGEGAAQAVQYVAYPEHTWEKLRKESPGKYESAANPAPDPADWFHARVVVKAATVDVYVDGADKPCLAVNRLSERASGSVGLWVEGGPATFAGFKITPERGPAAADPLESCWSDLEQDEATAARALLRFDARPREAVAFLADRMKPLRLDSDRAQLLLEQLGSHDKSVWKPAYEELEYFDPRLAVDLEQLMKDVTKPPARQRLVEILGNRPPGSLEGLDVKLTSFQSNGNTEFNFFDGRGSWWAERKVARLNTSRGTAKKKWTRAMRSIVFLEHVGTAEASEVLRAMAGGDPDAQLTRAAREALDRPGRGPGADDPAVAPDLARVGDPAFWRFVDASAEAVEEDGRKAARAAARPPARPDEKSAQGLVYFLGREFDEGTIEVDLKAAGGDENAFLGVAYHGITGEGFEAVVFQPSQFGREGDEAGRAVQYLAWPANTPEVLRKEHPGKYEHPVKPAPDPDGWFHARVVSEAQTVSVYVGGAKEPCLVVDRLSQRASGHVGFWASPGPATFANLKITPAP